MNKNGSLFSSFPTPVPSDWKAAASGEIGGADPFEKLSWKNDDGITFQPIYIRQDVLSERPGPDFHLTNKVEPRVWANMPVVVVREEKSANAAALAHLQNEAEGVLFAIEMQTPDFELLLKDILWQHCTVSFSLSNESQIGSLAGYMKGVGNSVDNITGACFSKSYFPVPPNIFKAGFRMHGLTIEAASPVEELGSALEKGTTVMNNLIDSGINPQIASDQIAFLLPLSADLLSNISKLKALRRLWSHAMGAYGLKKYRPGDVYIHGYSAFSADQKFQPHGNMLRSTVASIGGVSGGCNAITIEPEDAANTMMTRIARNVSHILRTESQLGKVNDPFAGSYAVEAMTQALEKAAWENFQSRI